MKNSKLLLSAIVFLLLMGATVFLVIFLSSRKEAGREKTRPTINDKAEKGEPKPATGDKAEKGETRPATGDKAGKGNTRPASGGKTAYRWCFCFGFKNTREDTDKIKELVDTCSEHGINGMVLSWRLDGITSWTPAKVSLLRELDAYCRQKGVEIIPIGFSVGYGGGALGYNRNFSAALPTFVPLKASAGKIIPVPGPNLVKNGDLEEHDGDRFKSYAFHDKPGEVSFADEKVFASGKCSIRFDNLSKTEVGHARIMQEVKIRPGRSYRFSFKIKTENVGPINRIQGLVLRLTEKFSPIATLKPKLKPTGDWTECAMDFINPSEKTAKIYAGLWEAKSGRFWLDDIRLFEHGSLEDIVRRDGTPLELRSLDRDMVFEEDRDFAKIENRPDLKVVAIPEGSRIRDGENLELSCYKAPYIQHPWGKQKSLCMSYPPVYDYWEKEAKRLYEVIHYKKFLLSMDEIRNGGGCELCRERKMSMAEILGDCVTKQHNIFKKIDPEIEVLVWSDMFDPNHNSRNNYYGVVGDFTGSWKYIPKDIVIFCWYHKMRDKSLPFFSEHGFRTMGAGYYDADDLNGVEDWLVSLEKTPGAIGIMYTTWQKKYKLLEDFGDLVTARAAEGKE